MSEIIPPSNDDKAPSNFLDWQREELAVRREEISLRREEIDLQKEELQVTKTQISTSAELSAKYLDHVKEDRTGERQASISHAKIASVTIIASIVAMLVFSGFAIAYGAKEVVTDVFKIGIGAVVGAFGGYGFAETRRRKRESATDIEPPESD